MSRLYGDDEELTELDAAIVKGMIERGDKNETIAAFFGVNQRAVSHIRTNQRFGHVQAVAADRLPPPGPYRVDPIYVGFYQAMCRVNLLWEERKLGEAKELLEAALRNPVYIQQLDEAAAASARVFRDHYGLSTL